MYVYINQYICLNAKSSIDRCQAYIRSLITHIFKVTFPSFDRGSELSLSI